MATDPKFATTARLALAQLSAANTNRDGTGTTVSIIAGVSTATRVDEIRVVATGTTTAGVIRFYLSTDGGTTKRLFREIIVPAVTPSTTIPVWRSGTLTFNNMNLPNANTIIYGSTHNAETFNVVAFGADY